jgi:hypothetical protein
MRFFKGVNDLQMVKKFYTEIKIELLSVLDCHILIC